MDDINKRKEQYSTYFHTAMQNGLYLGLYFVAIFSCFLLAVQYQVYFLWGVIFLSSLIVPVLTYRFTKQVRDNTLNGEMKFSTAWNFGTLLFFFGGLILAFVAYFIMQYAAPDLYKNFIQALTDFSAAVVNDATKNNVPQAQISLLEQQAKLLSEVPIPSSIEIAVQYLWNCVSIGILISIPIALIVKKTKKA